MSADWEIARVTGKCFATQRELSEGEAYYAVLMETAASLERRDYSVEGWTGPPEGTFCHWKGRIPVRSKNKGSISLDAELLTQLFLRFEESQAAPVQQLRFVLALLLMRKRLMRMERSEQRDGVEYWHLRLLQDGSSHEVPNPQLGNEQVDRLSAQLLGLLSGEVDAITLIEDPAPARGFLNPRRTPVSRRTNLQLLKGRRTLRLRNTPWLVGPALTLGVIGLTGCEDPGVPTLHLHRHHQSTGYVEEPSGPIEHAKALAAVVERVNQNAGQMNFMLRGGGAVARGEYPERHHLESYELKGTLLYRKPRDLYMQLQHSLGGKMEFGSNSKEFWVWKRLGKDHYWWGKQESVDKNQDMDIPLRPTDLVEVLGLSEMPQGIAATDFQVEDIRYKIQVTGRSASGQTYNAKTIYIDRREPHLVREMEYFYPDGVKRLDAKLMRYEAVDGTNVMTPRRIQIDWPERGGNMDLQFASMQRFDSEQAAGRFVSPMEQGRDLGITERVDSQAAQASGQ